MEIERILPIAMMNRWLMLLVFLVFPLLGAAGVRSDAVRHAFAKAQPCPSTGKPTLPCPGYIIDHLKPLCAGGLDAVENMQWQTVADAKKKDVFEVEACACMRMHAQGSP
jgi:hypothetical protein